MMKPFGQMNIEEMLRVLLYSELNGEKTTETDSSTKKSSLLRLLPLAKEKFGEIQSVISELKRGDFQRAKMDEMLVEWQNDQKNWQVLIEDAERAVAE